MEKSLFGKTVCMTGTFVYSRGQLSGMFEMLGINESKNCTKACDYLIVGADPGEPKLRNAEKYGTTIIENDEFYQLLREEMKGQGVKNTMTQNPCQMTGNEIRMQGEHKRQAQATELELLRGQVERLNRQVSKYGAYIDALRAALGDKANEVMMNVDKMSA